MQIVRKKLSADEISPPNIRYNGDCDCVETTYDGGGTWTAAPGADPRSAAAFRAPANATADPQCNAAANMVSRLRFMIDTDLASASIAGVASGLLAGILLFMPAVGIVVDAILIAVDVILGIGAGAIAAAFTEGVYDDFLCVFYCNIDPDGQMSDAQLTAIYSQVAAQFDSVVQLVFGAHSSTLGAVGWSNAGALGEIEDADCSECDCITPPELQIQYIDGTPYGQDLTEISVGVWQCTSHDFSSINHWVLLETVDPLRKFQVVDITLISGGGGFPWYRTYPSRATDEYVQADPTDVPDSNAVGQSRPDDGGFTIQYTIINS